MTRHRSINNHSISDRQASAQPYPKARRLKPHPLRCDCGQLAVIVLRVRVGTDPQYTVQLPLCPSCLALEQSFYTRD
ncbi:MAG: hypothetical protein WAV05_11045 [Anaerolineales bacterium]